MLGDIENTDVLHLWQQTYPRDYVPHNNLAVLLGLTGQYSARGGAGVRAAQSQDGLVLHQHRERLPRPWRAADAG
jgi:hypothetical protein